MREKMREMMIEKIAPAIDEKWPRTFRDGPVIVQQDNAAPHIKADDCQWATAWEEKDVKIHIVNQPAQSPDFNVLDLGLWSSIQADQRRITTLNCGQLIDCVVSVFSDMSYETIDNSFLTLMAVMNESLACSVGNLFKIPHIGKSKMKKAVGGEIVSIDVFVKEEEEEENNHEWIIG